MTQRPFLGGIPTSVDVKKITDAIGTPAHGRLVTYKELEVIISNKKEDSRFGSVVGAWRTMLRKEYNLITEGVRGEGVLILDNDRRVDHVVRGSAKGAKKIREIYIIAAMTPRTDLAPERVRVLDHQLNLLGAVMKTGHTIEKSRAIAPSIPKRIWGGELVERNDSDPNISTES